MPTTRSNARTGAWTRHSDFEAKVAEIRDHPEVSMHDCRMRGNSARGLLLNSRGKTLVNNNWFHVPGAALLFDGNASFWFEQGGVRDNVGIEIGQFLVIGAAALLSVWWWKCSWYRSRVVIPCSVIIGLCGFIWAIERTVSAIQA